MNDKGLIEDYLPIEAISAEASREFWRFLAVKEPGYKELDKQLRTAWRLVPAWLGQQAGMQEEI